MARSLLVALGHLELKNDIQKEHIDPFFCDQKISFFEWVRDLDPNGILLGREDALSVDRSRIQIVLGKRLADYSILTQNEAVFKHFRKAHDPDQLYEAFCDPDLRLQTEEEFKRLNRNFTKTFVSQILLKSETKDLFLQLQHTDEKTVLDSLDKKDLYMR